MISDAPPPPTDPIVSSPPVHEPSTAASPTRSNALDGIRGWFIAAPLLVHLGLVGADSGLWLAISMFFTLSGFLITTLALKEVGRTGGLSLTAFWARRLRRLMPAAIAVLAGTLVVSWLVDWRAMRALRNDVLASLFWMENWHELRGDGYWDSFAPSLTFHFWSLSLEEQVYLVFPLLVGLAVVTSRRAGAAVNVGLVAAAFLAVSWLILWNVGDAAWLYLATWSRMGEVAIGVLAAALAALVPRGGSNRLATTAIAVMGVLAIPVWVFCHGDTVSGVRWGVTLWSPMVALTVALLWRFPGSGAARVLGFAPFAWTGRRTYGIYLLHVPVIELLAHQLGVDHLPVWGMVLAVVLTFAVAAVMFRYLEEPIRTAAVAATPQRFGALIGLGVAGVVGLAVVSGREAVPFALPEISEAPTPAAAPPPTPPPMPATTTVAATAPPGSASTVAPPTTVSPFPLSAGNAVLAGDSTAWVVRAGVADAIAPSGWATDEVHMIGCPFGGDVRIKSSLDGGAVYTREVGEEPGCSLWFDQLLPEWLLKNRPGMVVLVGGYGLAYEVDPQGDDQWCRLGDGSGRCEAWAAERLAATTERIQAYAPGTHVVWTTPGHVDPWGPLDIPAGAIDSLEALIRAEAARSDASVVDLGSWLDDHLHLTVDGTHLGPEGVEALTPWLAVELPAAAAGQRLAS